MAEFPQFASLSEHARREYFQICIKNSEKVNSRFLELGININLPRTKGYTTESFKNMDDLMTYLANWMNNPNYVEVCIVVYTDGSIFVQTDDANTSAYGVLDYWKGNDGKYYVGEDENHLKEISWTGHTHWDQPDAYGDDFKLKKDAPGMDTRISITKEDFANFNRNESDA